MSTSGKWKASGDSPPRIRSFILRDSRITRAQQRALAELWGRFGIEADNMLLDPERLFSRCAPLVLEIGFGDGESLALMSKADPEVNYLGIEVLLYSLYIYIE